MNDIKIHEKYALTIEEAAAYFHIGMKHLRELIKSNPNAKWVLWNGTHATIKRKVFEEKLDLTNAI